MVRSTLILDSMVELPRVHLCRLTYVESWNLHDMAIAHWRFYAPIEAGGEIHFEGTTWKLAPTTWMLIPPHTQCSSRLTRPFHKAFCHFSWMLIDKRPQPGIYTGSIPRKQQEALRQLARHPDEDGCDDELALRLRAMTSSALLELPAKAFEHVARYSSAVNHAAAMLCADFRMTPSNEAIAGELQLHPGSLVRMFTREVGVSPQRYAMQHRLEHAAILLLETQDSVEQIAEACGFGDRYHFSRAFQQHWQIPPAAYRKQGWS